MAKYFLTENTAVELIVSGKKFEFQPTEFVMATNSWWGVLETSDVKDLELLAEATGKGRISEISSEDYAKYLAKKKTASALITSVPLKSPLEATPDQVPAVAPVVDTAPVKRPVSSFEEVIAPKPAKRSK